MTAFSVSVIIPAYNEEAIIKSAVKTALDILVNANADFEIIVINDGSRDNTRAILDQFFSNYSNITILHKPVNEGFGSAIRCGVKLAKKMTQFQ